MKRIFLGGIAACVLATAALPAVAADVPRAPVTKAAPAAVAAPFNWTGFYVGAHAGYGWGSTKHCDEPADACTPVFNIDGFVGGPTVGVNWQAGNWVFGIEADHSFGRIDGSVPTSLQFGCGDPCVTEVSRVSTLRGRVGPTFDRLFVYGTGGWAWGELFGEVSGVSNRDGRNGWTAGAGVEYAFAPNWSAKVEYLHVRLGSILSDPTGPYTTYGNFNLVRGGLNYRFASGKTPAPVVTKY